MKFPNLNQSIYETPQCMITRNTVVTRSLQHDWRKK